MSFKVLAGEHWSDAGKMSDDSHMAKHRLDQHPEGDVMPKFTFKVVASFRDALTSQVSEAVRIDMRGQRVLNRKSQYSRCQLPRLYIDVEEWRRRKLEDEKEKEKKTGDSHYG